MSRAAEAITKDEMEQGALSCREMGGKGRKLTSSTRFLSAALARSLEAMGFHPTEIRVRQEGSDRQNFDAAGHERQFVVTFEGTSVTIAHRCEDTDGRETAIEQERAAHASDPLVLLEESLYRAGINPGALCSSEDGLGKIIKEASVTAA